MRYVIGVIGGSGFYTFFGADAHSAVVETPYGDPSAPVTVGRVGDHEVAFLPRHGLSHEFSPHTVPYRANMWALRALGVRRVFGPCAAGSLTAELGPGAVVVHEVSVAVARLRASGVLGLGWPRCVGGQEMAGPSSKEFPVPWRRPLTSKCTTIAVAADRCSTPPRSSPQFHPD